VRTAFVVTVLLLMGGCHVSRPAPVVAPVALVANGTIIWTRERIVLPAGVDGNTNMCVEATAWMLFEEPNHVGLYCGLTVGELRSWLRRQARAD
jgi:hypothetical protein